MTAPNTGVWTQMLLRQKVGQESYLFCP